MTPHKKTYRIAFPAVLALCLTEGNTIHAYNVLKVLEDMEGEDSVTNKIQGTGLGIAITKK